MNRDLWFKDAVFYQIYPRSFCDSNGDGIGDIRGIISKLDYLKDLGITCVWLSPCYKSPNDDIGYDISDYFSINEEYGSMDDWKEMIAGMHSRGIRLIMDLVVNHTSDEHEWFQKSRDKNSEYRDYYYWKKGKGKRPPNNWNSCFTGPAWEYDEKSDEYYLHLFTKKQIDLNWENPKVREEVLNILNFWFELGVDGFRCDVINYISKTDNLPNDSNLFSPLKGGKYYTNGPRIHEYFNFLNENAFSKHEKLFLGECPGITTDIAKKFTARDRKEMDIAFAFDHMLCASILKYIPLKFRLRKLKKSLSKWQYGLMNEGWNSLFFENHDNARSISLFGDELEYRYESGKALATIIATLKGSLFLYEGQEIGMVNYPFEKIEDFIDTASQSTYQLATKKLHLGKKFTFKCFNKTARDHARTPMQWDGTKNGGFSTSDQTWMPVNHDYPECNVEVQQKDENSLLNYYKSLLAFRKNTPVIINGDYEELIKSSKNFFVYSRKDGENDILVVHNFSNKCNNLPKLPYQEGKYLFGTNEKSELYDKYLPYESRIFKI